MFVEFARRLANAEVIFTRCPHVRKRSNTTRREQQVQGGCMHARGARRGRPRTDFAGAYKHNRTVNIRHTQSTRKIAATEHRGDMPTVTTPMQRPCKHSFFQSLQAVPTGS